MLQVNNKMYTTPRFLPCHRQEMFRQGDRERAAGFLISPLMDRNKTGITKSQVGLALFEHRYPCVIAILLWLPPESGVWVEGGVNKTAY